MQQTSVIKCTEPNVVMNALHNCGAFAPCLSTTAREILREKYCIGPNICVSFLSPNCFINTFSFRHICRENPRHEVWKKCRFFFCKMSVTFVRLEFKLVYVDKFYQKSEILNLNWVKIRLAVAILPEVLTGARYDAMTRDKGRRQRLHPPL